MSNKSIVRDARFLRDVAGAFDKVAGISIPGCQTVTGDALREIATAIEKGVYAPDPPPPVKPTHPEVPPGDERFYQMNAQWMFHPHGSGSGYVISTSTDWIRQTIADCAVESWYARLDTSSGGQETDKIWDNVLAWRKWAKEKP